MQYLFEWDPNKARINLDKHGVSFRMAEGVFEDPMALTLFDEEHSWIEERWITLGVTPGGQGLLVVHTMVDKLDGVMHIRLISARRATKGEVRRYQEGEI